MNNKKNKEKQKKTPNFEFGFRFGAFQRRCVTSLPKLSLLLLSIAVVVVVVIDSVAVFIVSAEYLLICECEWAETLSFRCQSHESH